MRARTFAVAALLAHSAPAAAESSIACARGIVSLGDTKVDLLGKCGEPALRDGWTVSTAIFVPHATGASAAGVIEQWTYDFGSSRFLQVVTLEMGKVVAIERGGYGYGDARPSDARRGSGAVCESSAIRAGDTKYDLLAKCGEPTARDARTESRPVSTSTAGGPTLTTVQVEVWTYDLGPGRFIAIDARERQDRPGRPGRLRLLQVTGREPPSEGGATAAPA
jgi:hypothetical protein